MGTKEYIIHFSIVVPDSFHKRLEKDITSDTSFFFFFATQKMNWKVSLYVKVVSYPKLLFWI